MPPSQEATLARVRNNQRRSRANRKEYILSLERKVQNYEAGESPVNAASQSSLRHLERENKRLKSFLEAVGLPRIWMDAYLKLDNEDAKNGNHSLRENVISTAGSLTDGLEVSSFINTAISGVDKGVPRADCSLFDAPSIPEVVDYDFFTWPDTAPSFELSTPPVNFSELVPKPLEPQLSSDNDPMAKECSGSFCKDDDCGSSSSGKSIGNTTACTVAYQMVLQYNSKGVDMLEINLRLQRGFRSGERGCAACTVDNKVLFDVLGYINS